MKERLFYRTEVAIKERDIGFLPIDGKFQVLEKIYCWIFSIQQVPIKPYKNSVLSVSKS